MYGTVSPMKGKKFTESHKQKISEAIKKAYRPHMYGGTNPSAKKVRNIDTGEVFETMTEASKNILEFLVRVLIIIVLEELKKLVALDGNM